MPLTVITPERTPTGDAERDLRAAHSWVADAARELADANFYRDPSMRRMAIGTAIEHLERALGVLRRQQDTAHAIENEMVSAVLYALNGRVGS